MSGSACVGDGNEVSTFKLKCVVGSSPTGGAEFSSFFPFYLLSFLYPFLCTSLHSALSDVESGARCATTEGPAPPIDE